jgi:hypothetical protein
MTGTPTLTQQDHQRAWLRSYRHSLDQQANDDIEWEVARWQALGAPDIAAIGEAMLAERDAFGFAIPSETTAEDLDRLWRHVDHDAVLHVVRIGALCLLAATRLRWWLFHSPEAMAA